MKAIRVHEFGDPSVLRLEEVERPRVGTGQVLVRVEAAGVNPVETYIRSGAYGERGRPYTPGTDAGGTVAESRAEGLRKGDRVFTTGSISGTYAEYALCDAGDVHLMPARLSAAQGAAVGVPYPTAYRALFQKARARAGERVLIHGGTGGVGTAALQWGRLRGLRLVASAGTDEGKAQALEQGAEDVVPHGDVEAVLRLTGGAGVDAIIEMLANVNLDRDLAMLARGGRVVVVGNRGRVEIDARQIMRQESMVTGVLLFSAAPEERSEIYAALRAGLESGVLDPVVGQEIPLAEAARAHEAVLKAGARGKIVLTVLPGP